MSSGAGEKGEFKPLSVQGSQQQPGTEMDMEPTSEATKLEGPGRFLEYEGVGKLKGKKVLITGGDSGIGRSIAILMARENADVSIVYLPDEQEDAEKTQKAVEAEKQSCLLLPGNLMDNHTCKDAVDQHVKKYGRIDCLINNASKQVQCAEFAEIDLEQVESVFRSNILQMFAITKYAVPHMKKGSTIINTTSVVAFRGTASMVDYASTKGAIVGFTRALAKNLLPKGIRVNAVAPGPVHTPIQPASRPQEQMEDFGKGSQLGRAGQPSEIAPTYVFLASGESELYYGQIMHPYPMGD
ncbi:oxidoreductase [Lasallia pustulata]|nr:oxidoreductase [Lasallia pustulata]